LGPAKSPAVPRPVPSPPAAGPAPGRPRPVPGSAPIVPGVRGPVRDASPPTGPAGTALLRAYVPPASGARRGPRSGSVVEESRGTGLVGEGGAVESLRAESPPRRPGVGLAETGSSRWVLRCGARVVPPGSERSARRGSIALRPRRCTGSRRTTGTNRSGTGRAKRRGAGGGSLGRTTRATRRTRDSGVASASWGSWTGPRRAPRNSPCTHTDNRADFSNLENGSCIVWLRSASAFGDCRHAAIRLCQVPEVPVGRSPYSLTMLPSNPANALRVSMMSCALSAMSA